MEHRWILRTIKPEEILLAREQGFEDVEPSLSALMQFEPTIFAKFTDAIKEAGFSCEVFESPLPREVQVTERGFNIFSWTEYLKKTLDKGASLGCKLLVWADGFARVLPAEGETSIQKEHFSQFLFMLCEAASRFEISVCIEPASLRVTNFLTTAAEVAEIIASVGQPNLFMMLSSAYSAQAGLDFQELKPHAALLSHVHIEHPATRKTPLPPSPEDGFDYRAFIHALEQECGYSGSFALPAGVLPAFFSILKEH